MLSRAIVSLVRIWPFVLLAPAIMLMEYRSAIAPKKVLIIQDELPQIEVLTDFLREQGGLAYFSSTPAFCGTKAF